MTKDQKLFDAVLSNALNVLRLGAAKRAAAIARLNGLAKELAQKLNAGNIAAANRREAAAILATANKLIDRYYAAVMGELELGDIARTIAGQTRNSLQIVLGLDALDLPLDRYFASVASNVLIEGAPSKDWWNRQGETLKFQFASQVRQGLASAETNQQIVQRIVGKQGQPGIMETSKRNAAALVQTSVQAVANDARLETFKSSKTVKGVRQVSTLDSHTTDICIAYSGAEWDLDGKPLNGAPAFNNGPPRHFNCRSVLVPITKTWKELGVNLPEFEPSTRASDEGPISAKTTFDEFLRRKGREYQDAILGPGRADLWRRGKITLRDLVAGDGRPLTLDELRELAE